ARGVLLYSARNRARGPGSIRHGAIEVDQPVASRFVAGTHRIVRVHGNLARAMSENLPEPGLLILRCYRRSDSHAADALASLQFANPETFAVAVTGGADKVQPGGQHPVRPHVHHIRIDRGAKEIRSLRHLPVVRLAVAVRGGNEESGIVGVAGNRMTVIRTPNGDNTRVQIFRQLVINKGAPIQIIRVGKDGGKSWRRYLIPASKAPIPSGVQRIEGF